MIRVAITLTALTVLASCALVATRPVQEMSDTGAALRAAKEVQADTLAPELYRQANEWWLKARHEYKFKNFADAQEYAHKARKFAEQAEFEALKNGGNRTDIAPPDLSGPPADQSASTPQATPTPYEYPTPTGTPADEYEQRKAEDDAKKAAEEKAFDQMTAATPETYQQNATSGPPVILNPSGATGPAPTTPGAAPSP